MIVIIDYGSGNVSAFANVYRRLNVEFRVAQSAQQLKDAAGLVLPGVGAFDYAMDRLNESALIDTLSRLVIEEKCPLLGVCVGMQMLANSSEEGSRAGLSWIGGTVRKFDTALLPERTPLPHMGWNNVKPTAADGLFAGVQDSSRFYFLHSFYFEAQNREDVAATTDYGTEFASAVCRDNVFGVQFHPEKSHHDGVRLLKNFAKLASQSEVP